MLTERTTTLFVSIFYFQKCQTRDYKESRDGRQAGGRCAAQKKAAILLQTTNSKLHKKLSV